MPTRIKHPEWRANHDPTKYPFEDRATLVNDDGDILFESTFLDMSLYPVGGKPGAYLSKVVVTASTATIWIGDEENTELASTSFDIVDPPAELRLEDTYGRPAGVFVSEATRLAIFQSWGTGIHEFQPNQTPLVTDVYVPTPEVGVKGILLEDGSLIAGDIWLVGDDGVILSCEETEVPAKCSSESITYTTVTVNIVGDPLFRRRLCPAPSHFQTPNFLQSICFQTPNRPDVDGVPPTETFSDLDIMFLTDTTASMVDYIAAVKATFPEIINGVQGQLPGVDFLWAVADYKDFEDGPEFGGGYRINSSFKVDPNEAFTGVLSWSATGGGDVPEQNLAALQAIANDWEALGGRTTVQARRAIVWAGDVPGWENFAKGNDYPTLQATLDTLEAQGVAVFPVNIKAAGDGIDSPGAGPADGRLQASTIADATGGEIAHNLDGTTQSLVRDAIIEAILSAEGGTPSEVGTTGQQVCCGPGDFGDIKITVGSQDAADTILRVRAVPEGLVFEAVGERLEDIR